MGGFLSSLFTGSSPGLSGASNTAGNVAGFGTSTGMGDTRSASDFLHSIIGGDPASISRLLAPQIGQMAGQANQKIQTAGEFGNRSGGQNASAEATQDQTRGNIDDMISHLTGGAVGQLGQLGQGLLNTGLSADELKAKFAQEQLQNQQNSILGGLAGGLGSNLGTIITGGIGKIPGLGTVI